MGNKLSTTHRRLGIPFLGPNSTNLHYDKPFELRGFNQDLYGWSQSTPNNVGVQQARLSIKKALNLELALVSYCKALKLILLRRHFIDHFNYYQVHCFVLKNNILVNNNLLEDSLFSWLKLSKPIIVTWHQVNPVDNSLFLKYERQFKVKALYKIGYQALSLLPYLPSNQFISDWLASCFEQLNRPNIRLLIIQQICNNISKEIPLKGILIEINGRLNGADKAKSLTFKWGVVPRRSLSCGIYSSLRESHTSHGVLGIRFTSYYY